MQKTICCNLTSSARDDGRMRPKHVELNNFNKLHCCMKLSFHFISWWRCTVKQPSNVPVMSNGFVEPLQVTTNAFWWHMTSAERLPGTSSCSTQKCFSATSSWTHRTLRRTWPFWVRTRSRSSSHGTLYCLLILLYELWKCEDTVHQAADMDVGQQLSSDQSITKITPKH